MAFDVTIGGAAQPDTGFDVVIGDDPSPGNGAVIDMSIPTTVMSGNTLLALVVSNDEVFPVQTGWTRVISRIGGGGIFLDGYARDVNGEQGTVVTFLAEEEQELQGTLLELADSNVSTLVEATAHASWTATTSIDSPDILSTQIENTIVVVYSANSAVTLTPPTGFTALDSFSSSAVSSRTLLIASREAGDTVDIDIGAATSAPSSTGRAFTLTLFYDPPPPLDTATIERIRDRIIAVISALTPSRLTTRFRHSQDEGNADFQSQMEGNPAGAFRRFQVRDSGSTEPPEVSMVDIAQHEATMTITVAYPHDKRSGPLAGRDRDDVIDADWRKIDFAVGLHGRSNFSGTNNCTPLGCTKTIERGEACDFLAIEFRCLYLLTTDE